MKDWLHNYIKDNISDLLKADLKIARILGAPKGFTLSGWSWKLEQDGKPWGKFWRPIIDKVWGLWIMKQQNHCALAYQEDLERANA